MKGVIIHEQLEYRVESEKDFVVQGEQLTCRLSIKNHGAAAQEVKDVTLEFSYGNPKDSKEGTYELIEAAEIPKPWLIAPGESVSQPFTFQLTRNCPISDKSNSPLFRFGAQSRILGTAPVTVQPHAIIGVLAHTLESIFQFVPKGQKSSKGWVESKFKPSSAKKFNFVDELLLRTQFDESAILLQFVFKVKNLDATSSKVTVSKNKVQVDKRIEESTYLKHGFLNHEAIDAVLGEALEVVANKF